MSSSNLLISWMPSWFTMWIALSPYRSIRLLHYIAYQVRFAYVSFRSATQDGVPLVDSAVPCVLLKIITVFAVFCLCRLLFGVKVSRWKCCFTNGFHCFLELSVIPLKNPRALQWRFPILKLLQSNDSIGIPIVDLKSPGYESHCQHINGRPARECFCIFVNDTWVWACSLFHFCYSMLSHVIISLIIYTFCYL